MTNKPKRPKLPRSLVTPEVDNKNVYRASIYAERQKLNYDQDKTRQLLLTEEGLEEDELKQVLGTPIGLELSVAQDRALCAIQILLAETQFQGNQPAEERRWPAEFKIQNRWAAPVILCTPTEFLIAYGLTQGPNGTFPRNQRDNALQALKDLTQPTARIIYERSKWIGKNQLTDAIVLKNHSPIRLSEATTYRDLNDEEWEALKDGDDLPMKQRTTKLIIEVSPILVDGANNGFYVLKPTALHQELSEHFGAKQFSPAVPRFISWLLTLSYLTIHIAKDKLTSRLRLDPWIKQRKLKRRDEILQQCITAAQSLGYITAYEENPMEILTFHLNPELCTRCQKKARAIKAKENN